MKDGGKTVLYFIGALGVIWLALLVAPIEGGVAGWIGELPMRFTRPWEIQWCEQSLTCIVLFLGLYAIGIGLYRTTRRKYRRREEYGSAQWGDVYRLCRKYRDGNSEKNRILTQHMQMGLDGKKHRRNLNTLICGGSGSGKTRFYCKPNILQGNSSYVILDPKGEILRDTGYCLLRKGYAIKVLNLINMQQSDRYNPFRYLRTENDVIKLVTNLFKATTPQKAVSNDPFWDTAAKVLLQALMFLVWKEAIQEEQNFATILELLRYGQVREDDDQYISPLDELFDWLESEKPDHIAVKYYRDYRTGSGKTLKSIQITLAARLEKFNLESVAELTKEDDLELPMLGQRKTALFAIIPDNDTSFNFLVSVLYTQLFQELFFLADDRYHGALPVAVHCVMDEFANVSLPEDFEKILSVMRSRNVSVSIILQNLAQLKALFEKQWESIVGNCDEFLYLGGNEQSTHKYVSDLLGKETIDTNTYGRSSGRSGSYSTNYQMAGRELLTPDEVRKLDNRRAILLIRGEKPILDEKYDLMCHPYIQWSGDGHAPAYTHKRQASYAMATIQIQGGEENE